MNTLTKEQKQLIKGLLESELKEFQEDTEGSRPLAGLFAAEEKYEEALKELIKKFS